MILASRTHGFTQQGTEPDQLLMALLESIVPGVFSTQRDFFFFQAEDGIRDDLVTGVQTCALPISSSRTRRPTSAGRSLIARPAERSRPAISPRTPLTTAVPSTMRRRPQWRSAVARAEIGRASCRERVWISVGVGAVRRQDIQDTAE